MFRTLISVEALHRELSSPGLRVIDCRFALAEPAAGERQYREGHIPGAIYAHLENDLSGPVTETTGRHPLPRRETLSARFARWGIARDTQVVAYDASGGAMAARLWWLLRWMGHERVAVLDGGWQAWCEAGFEVERDVRDVVPVEFAVHAPLSEAVTSRDVEEMIAGSATGCLIDARGAERFRGEIEPIDPVAGHVPGAMNIPFAENVGPDGRFLDAATLRSRFEKPAADNPSKVVHYCGSGVTACHNVLAMEHAGLAGSRLYAGSWSEWIRDASRAVSKGE